ncbi:hypothetical protein RND71_041562 [Anisodus tanguticus]|uniref:malate dehydrogenase n=1 Tax=Anisodus tanguticus TaxID=243964 RepID=A0AAE1QUU3_9SOLA|nr:hypothetical protein RND71_041562 [Anisodus tanguticus]
MQPSRAEVHQRIARISAHLYPSNPQIGEGSMLERANCRAKGGAPGFKVAILGAAGGIGQPLAMLMKMNHLVSVLHLYDVVNAPGVTADISHMDTGAVVRGYLGQSQLEGALTGMDLVIIPAGIPRKPGMTRDDLFKINAGIVRTLCEGIAKCCPNAIVNLISNPVNSTVPIAAEVFKKAGTYDPKKLLGVTSLDVVRANTFVCPLYQLTVNYSNPSQESRLCFMIDFRAYGISLDTSVTAFAEVLGLDPREVEVKPPCSFTPEETEYLTKRIQDGGTEVVGAKKGAGSATLSTAYAAVKFADACLKGLRGDACVVACAFVASQVTELPFCASKVRLGRLDWRRPRKSLLRAFRKEFPSSGISIEFQIQ